MSTVTLTDKFQITIPKDIRERMGLTAGRKVGLTEVAGMVYLVPVPTAAELQGSFKGANKESYRDRTDRFERPVYQKLLRKKSVSTRTATRAVAAN